MVTYLHVSGIYKRTFHGWKLAENHQKSCYWKLYLTPSYTLISDNRLPNAARPLVALGMINMYDTEIIELGKFGICHNGVIGVDKRKML